MDESSTLSKAVRTQRAARPKSTLVTLTAFRSGRKSTRDRVAKTAVVGVKTTFLEKLKTWV